MPNVIPVKAGIRYFRKQMNFRESGNDGKGIYRALLSSILPVLFLAATTGCATRVITGHPPQMDLHALVRDGQVITLELNLRNVNDDSLTLSHMNLRLELSEALLLHINQSLHLTMPARGRDRVRVEMVGGLAGLEVLDALEQGQDGSRPWRLRGSLLNERGRELRIDVNGHLYRVPGRPGQFR